MCTYKVLLFTAKVRLSSENNFPFSSPIVRFIGGSVETSWGSYVCWLVMGRGDVLSFFDFP